MLDPVRVIGLARRWFAAGLLAAYAYFKRPTDVRVALTGQSRRATSAAQSPFPSEALPPHAHTGIVQHGGFRYDLRHTLRLLRPWRVQS